MNHERFSRIIKFLCVGPTALDWPNDTKPLILFVWHNCLHYIGRLRYIPDPGTSSAVSRESHLCYAKKETFATDTNVWSGCVFFIQVILKNDRRRYPLLSFVYTLLCHWYKRGSWCGGDLNDAYVLVTEKVNVQFPLKWMSRCKPNGSVW